MAPDPLRDEYDNETAPRRQVDLSHQRNTITYDPQLNLYYAGSETEVTTVYDKIRAEVRRVERSFLRLDWGYDSNAVSCDCSSWGHSWFEAGTGPGDTTEKIRWRKYWKEFLGYRYGHRGTDWAQPSHCSYHKARFSPQRLGHAVATRKRPLSPIQRCYRNAIKRASQPRQPHRML
jgi:hypothetical protein